VHDMNQLDKIHMFAPVGKLNDAGVLLNPMIEWSHGLHEPEFPKGWRLPNNWPMATMVTWGAGFEVADLSRADRDILADVDVSWMAKLKDFDHWDLYAYGPFQKISREDLIRWNRNYWDIPRPLLGFFDTAALRLNRGLKSGDPLTALREVHQLANLLYSTETVYGAYMALDIFDVENIFYKKALALGYTMPTDLRVFSEEETDLARRVLSGTAVFMGYNLVRDQELFKKIFDRAELSTFACAAYTRSVSIARFQKEFAPQVDGDLDSHYSYNMDLLRERILPSCRLTYWRAGIQLDEWVASQWADEKTHRDFWRDMATLNTGPWTQIVTRKILLKIPFARNVYFQSVAAEDQPYFSREVERESARKMALFKIRTRDGRYY